MVEKICVLFVPHSVDKQTSSASQLVCTDSYSMKEQQAAGPLAIVTAVKYEMRIIHRITAFSAVPLGVHIILSCTL